MVDTHCHLSRCEGSPGEIVGRASAAGVTRLLTVGLDEAGNRAQIDLCRSFEGVYAAVGRHPNEADGYDAAAAADLRELAGHEKVRAIGETGLDFYRDTAEPENQRRAFHSQIEIAIETGLPIVIHMRDRQGSDDAAAETFAMLDEAGEGLTVILHCFSAPQRVSQAAERGWYCSFAGNVTYPANGDLREAAAVVPDELILVETDSPYLTPQSRRRHRNEPANVVETASPRGGGPWHLCRGVRPDRHRKLPSALRLVRLGQNFLADPNLLEAIVRDSGVAASDCVLEVGAGEGVLTERLAAVAERVHVIEIDRGLEPGLTGTAALPNVNLIWADAVRFDLGSLEPPPTAMVANLPYSVATPVIMRTIFELPSLNRWTVMVQREIADRLRAEPGSKAYGSPSVLAQLAGPVSMIRKVSRTVFRPPPRVDSAIISIEREGAGPDERVRALVRAAFSHRRKALPRSIDMAVPGLLEPVREALDQLGIGTGVRAEELSPPQFAALSAMIDARPPEAAT